MMKTLKVLLSDPLSDRLSSDAFALPLKVFDLEGSLVGEGAASRAQAAIFKIPKQTDPVFVSLTWPSGKTQTKRINFDGVDATSVSFMDETIRRDEWSAWAVPRLHGKSELERREVDSAIRIDRFDRVWLRLWKFSNGLWGETSIRPIAQYRNSLACQVDLHLEENPWLLQIGGANVPWRLVSLVGGGPCRVLLTPNDSKDPRADPLKIIVTSFRYGAETLLEFLSRDSMAEAKALSQFPPLAQRIFDQKAEDPIAVVAGAYFLLRIGDWNSISTQLFEELADVYRWIPDAAVICCVVLIRRGLRDHRDKLHARKLLEECIHRGLPVFAEGLSLMQEAASVLRGPTESTSEGLFGIVQRVAASEAWAGSAFSFYGQEPALPSPEKVVGYPSQARALKKKSEPSISVRSASRRRRVSVPSMPNSDEEPNSAISISIDYKVDYELPLRNKESLLFLGDIGNEAVVEKLTSARLAVVNQLIAKQEAGEGTNAPLQRIHAKISELEAKIANLRVAEREIMALDQVLARQTKTTSAPKPKQKPGPKATPPPKLKGESKASKLAPPRQTIGAAITEVLDRYGALSAAEITERIQATGRDITNRTVSFALQALKKRGLAKSAEGQWTPPLSRTQRGRSRKAG